MSLIPFFPKGDAKVGVCFETAKQIMVFLRERGENFETRCFMDVVHINNIK